jgi:hypothetical protein
VPPEWLNSLAQTAASGASMFGMMHAFPTAQQQPPRRASLGDRPRAYEAPLSPPVHERRASTGSEAAADRPPPGALSPVCGRQGAPPRRDKRNLNILTHGAARKVEDAGDGTRRLQREPRTPPTPPCDEGRAALRDSAAERVAIATALAPSPARERPLAQAMTRAPIV